MTLTKGSTKVRIKLRAFDYKLLDKTCQLIVASTEKAGSKVIGPILLPIKIKKFTINRSTFVHKDAREQYEIRTHNRLIDILNPTPKTIESISNLNIPSGVDIEIKMI